MTDTEARVLVLGATGFVGGWVCAELDLRGVEYVGVGRTAPAGIDLATATQHEVDRVVTDVDPTVVVNCAGATYGTAHDLTRGNVLAIHALLSSLAWSAPTARLVQIGSVAEYGGAEHGAMQAEDAPLRPEAAYGVTKLAGSEMVLRARRDGADAVVVRLFNLSGPGSPPSTLLGRVADRLRSGEATVRLGPLDVWRDYLDVRDAAAAICATALAVEPPPPVLNVGSGEAVHARAAVHRLVEVSGTGAVVVEEAAPHAGHAGSPATVRWQCADITAVTATLGWRPAIDLDTSLADTWTGRSTTGTGREC